jgi:hypothetical protein
MTGTNALAYLSLRQELRKKVLLLLKFGLNIFCFLNEMTVLSGIENLRHNEFVDIYNSKTEITQKERERERQIDRYI